MQTRLRDDRIGAVRVNRPHHTGIIPTNNGINVTQKREEKTNDALARDTTDVGQVAACCAARHLSIRISQNQTTSMRRRAQSEHWSQSTTDE